MHETENNNKEKKDQQIESPQSGKKTVQNAPRIRQTLIAIVLYMQMHVTATLPFTNTIVSVVLTLIAMVVSQ